MGYPALTMMKKMDVNSPVKGIAGLALDTGIEFGAGYGLGQMYVRHRDKWVGRNAPRLAAAVGKGGAALVHLLSGSSQANFLSGALNAVGSAGVAAVGMEYGLAHARKAKGLKVAALPASAALPSGAQEITTIGALDQAGPGRGLSWAQIEELASAR